MKFRRVRDKEFPCCQAIYEGFTINLLSFVIIAFHEGALTEDPVSVFKTAMRRKKENGATYISFDVTSKRHDLAPDWMEIL